MSLKSIDFGKFEKSKGINSTLGELKQTGGKSQDKEISNPKETILPENDLSSSTVHQNNSKAVPNSEKDNSEIIYIYVGNIPKDFRSADLRIFFSEFIEKGAFECFHFRHRPETAQIKIDKESEDIAETKETNTTCCIVKLKKKPFKKFKKKYHKRRWYGVNHIISHKTFCNVFKMNIKSKPSKKYLNNKESKEENHTLDQDIYLEDFSNLIEFDPPVNVMPQGNVGTPTETFHTQIANCTLPSSVIKSLGLSFKKSSKKYSSVEMDYNTTFNKIHHPSDDEGGSNETENSDSDIETKKPEDEGEDNDAEEWDRYNTLHDDVDNQSRPKERLFEEDLELKWEKGGSGLVFYTDAYFWNEMKGKDFDEDTVDDWDVDYNVYYEDGAGDKPSRDQLKMRVEQRRRAGKADGPTKYSEIRQKEKVNRKRMTENFAEFEKHSNAFGSRILKRHGWNQGEGVGSSKQGIKEPINLQGQLPRKKIGLGFYGEKLDSTVALKKPRLAENDVYISTIYDSKDGEQIDAMRFHGKELLSYRTPKIEFRKHSNIPGDK